MFYIYKFYRGYDNHNSWSLFTFSRFTSTRDCETYLRNLNYTLDGIAIMFCFRWFAYQPQFLLVEYKSETLYPGLKSKLSYRKAAANGR